MAESGSTSSQMNLLTPTVSNFSFEFDMNLYENEYKIISLCLRHSILTPAMSKTVMISHKVVGDLVNFIVEIDDKNRRFKIKIGEEEVQFSKADFCRMLELPIPSEVDNVTPVMIMEMFNYMGHHPPLMMVSKFRNSNISSVWGFLFTSLYRCLIGATTSVDQGNTVFYKIYHHVVYGSKVHIGEIIWEEFVKCFRKRLYGTLPSPRFWALITHHIYTKKNFQIPTSQPLFKAPFFKSPIFVKQPDFPRVCVITQMMADRIDDINEPTFIKYLAQIPLTTENQQP